MRTVSSTLLNAIQKPYSSKPLWRATIYNDKLNASTWQTNYVSDMAGKPQSFCYHSGQGLFYAVYNYEGTLYGVKHNSTIVYNIVSGVNSNSRPLLMYISNTLYLYYTTSTGYLRRATLNDNFGIVSSANSTQPVSEYQTALHPYTPSDPNKVMIFDINSGAIRVAYANWSGSDWTVSRWNGRFAYPSRKITDYSELKYTATTSASISGTTFVFCFVSDWNDNPSENEKPSGKVYGVAFGNGQWSDVFTAIPADLSYAVVSNGFSYNNVMYLSLLFRRRNDPPENSEIFGRQLFCRSTDGFNWSMAENDYVMTISEEDLPQGYADANYFYSGQNNTYKRAATPGSSSLSIPFDRILNFSDQETINGGSNATLILANRDEYYNTQTLIQEGNKVVVEAGYTTTAGDEYVVWGTYCIDSISEIFGDAQRSFQLNLVSQGIYKVMQYIHPVEFEISGKSYYYRSFNKEGGFYTASKAGIYQDWFMVDFWKSEPWRTYSAQETVDVLKNDGVAPIKFVDNHNKSVRSADLVELLNLVEYPTPIVNQSTGNLEQITVSVWAWSRSYGSSNNNDAIYPFLIIERDGVEYNIEGISGNPNPNPPRPPKYYEGTASGGYPITYNLNMASLQAGDKIKRVGVRFVQTTSTKTLIERIKLSNVTTIFSDGYGNTPWEYDKTSGCYYLSRYGRPYVQFSQEPGNPQHFQVWGEFSASNTSAYTEWGLVGFGYDSNNFVAGILAKDDSNGLYAAIVQYIDGKRYQWTSTSTSINPASKHYLMFEHAYGQIRLYARQSTANAWTQLISTTLHRNYVTPAAKDPGIMHVGFYAMIKPLMMQIVGYKPVDSQADIKNDGIAILPGYESALSSMPSSGTIQIGDSKYSYGAKVSPSSLFGNMVIGPFQALSMKSFNGVTGVENTCFKKGETNSIGCFLASDIGYAWEVNSSVWDISDTSEGYLFMSRHFGANMKDNYLSNHNRTYFSGGFKTISDMNLARNHLWGEWAFNNQSDTIRIYRFAAAGGEQHRSLKEMADYIVSVSGAQPVFADYTASTLALTGGNITYIRSGDYYAPFGYDVEWDLPLGGMTTENWIAIYYARAFKIGSSTGNLIGVRKATDGNHYVCALDTSYNVIEEINVGVTPGKFRFVYYKDHCTVYEGGAWAHTFFFDGNDGVRSAALGLMAKSGYNPTIRNVVSVELFPEREAVLFAMAASPQSALSDVFQERPILLIPISTGQVLISYYNKLQPPYAPTAYNVSGSLCYVTAKSRTGEKEAASDLIVYYADGIKMYKYQQYLERGFRTFVYSFPNIDENEIDLITRLKAHTNWEEKELYQIDLRPDYRIEPGDLINFSFTLSGTNTTINLGQLYILDVQITASANRMRLTCRRNLA